jgi:hypothetical protein
MFAVILVKNDHKVKACWNKISDENDKKWNTSSSLTEHTPTAHPRQASAISMLHRRGQWPQNSWMFLDARSSQMPWHIQSRSCWSQKACLVGLGWDFRLPTSVLLYIHNMRAVFHLTNQHAYTKLQEYGLILGSQTSRHDFPFILQTPVQHQRLRTWSRCVRSYFLMNACVQFSYTSLVWQGSKLRYSCDTPKKNRYRPESWSAFDVQQSTSSQVPSLVVTSMSG